MDKVPSARTDGLGASEQKLLRDCYNMTYEEGAKALVITYSSFRTHWHNIFEKVGTSNDVQVVLMAMKDGLIPVD